jgi:NAD(P)-dependent dehydrogenase (short-subunit alcohol dehydrogenase family)
MSTVLITGANRGIGLALTQQYLEQGWRVLACCRHPENAESLSRLANNPHLSIFQLDVCNQQQLSTLTTTLAHETIDVLFSNAGVYGPSGLRFGETPVDEWLKTFEVNSIAPLKLAEAFIEQVARSQLKTIAIVSSLMGSISDNGYGNAYIYRSSKAAVNAICKSLSIDLAKQDIKSVVLHPGWVKTAMGGENALITSAESAEGLIKIVNNLTTEQSGQFFNYKGDLLQW